MNIIRKFVGMLAVFALAATAGQAMAQSKTYTFAFGSLLLPYAEPGSGTSQVDLVVWNAGPSSDTSTIKYIRIDPPNGITVAPRTGVAPTNDNKGTVVPSGNSLIVSNFSGLVTYGRPQYRKLIIRLTVTRASVCSTTWTPANVTAYTGNSGEGGSPFTHTAPNAAPVPEPEWQAPNYLWGGSTCALTFDKGPGTTLAGALITDKDFGGGNPVQVKATIDGVPTSAIPVNLAAGCIDPTSTTVSTSTAPAGYSAFPGLKAGLTTGACTMTATSPGFQSASAQFTIAAVDGTLNCGDSVPTGIANPGSVSSSEPGYAASTRGQFNSDGQECALVRYDFTNLIIPGSEVELKWDITSQPAATFFTSVNWKAKNFPAEGEYPKLTQPQVAWEFNALGEPLNPTPALMCLSAKLPKPYGRIPTTGLPATDLTFTLDTSIAATPAGWETVPPTPFPIYVNDERMKVTAISGTIWTVERAQAFTPKATPGVPAAHPGSAYVMSTPMPIAPTGYYSGKAVRMCIVQHGIKVYTPDPDGKERYFEYTDYMDGDGWIGTEDQ